MPKDTSVTPFPNAYIDRTGQKPLTKIRDMENSLKVEVLKIYGIDSSLLEFTHCAHYNVAPDYTTDISSVPNYEPGDTEEQAIVKGLMEGTALWQGLETVNFKLKITGCSRIFTHQLVRARVGVTFSQQCSGDMDWRHHNMVMPRPLNDDRVIDSMLTAKETYCYLLDEKKRSIQESRYILPQCLETFIYMNANLACLSPLYSKRMCSMTQTWEMILFAKKLKAAIVKKAPFLERAFKDKCGKGQCWYQGAKEGKEETFLYQPDAAHDRFPWHPDSYIYDGNVVEISSGEPVPESYYSGKSTITETKYSELENKLKIWE